MIIISETCDQCRSLEFMSILVPKLLTQRTVTRHRTCGKLNLEKKYTQQIRITSDHVINKEQNVHFHIESVRGSEKCVTEMDAC